MRIDCIRVCIVHVPCHSRGIVSLGCVSHRMRPLLQAALSGYVLADPEKLSQRMWTINQ